MISKLNDLNNIHRNSSKYGIYKRWIYKKEDYNKMCDYIYFIFIKQILGVFPRAEQSREFIMII